MQSYVAKESLSDYPMGTHGPWPGKTYIYRESDGQIHSHSSSPSILSIRSTEPQHALHPYHARHFGVSLDARQCLTIAPNRRRHRHRGRHNRRTADPMAPRERWRGTLPSSRCYHWPARSPTEERWQCYLVSIETWPAFHSVFNHELDPALLVATASLQTTPTSLSSSGFTTLVAPRSASRPTLIRKPTTVSILATTSDPTVRPCTSGKLMKDCPPSNCSSRTTTTSPWRTVPVSALTFERNPDLSPTTPGPMARKRMFRLGNAPSEMPTR